MLLRIVAFVCLAMAACSVQAADDCPNCKLGAVVHGASKAASKVVSTTANVVGAVIPGNRQSCQSHCSSHHRKVFKGCGRRVRCRR